MLAIAAVAVRSAPYYAHDLLPPGGRGAGAILGEGAARDGVIEESSPGTWHGRAAAQLGWHGTVDRVHLEAALEGRPAPGRPSLRSRPATVAGFDLTFSAPKSASLLFALGDPEVAATVLAAHRGALNEALAYLEVRAAAVRRTQGEERRLLPVDGIAAALFTHGTSRAGDPHLHTHAVVTNMAHGADGRWAALDGRGLYAHRFAAGALYECDLRARLGRDLGVTWRPAGPARFEVAGIDGELLGAFSGRAAEIRADLTARGLHSARAGRVAAARTRPPKDMSAAAEVTARWTARAAGMGWGAPELAACLGPEVRVAPSLDEHRFVARLCGSGAQAVTRRDVVAAWAGALVPGAPAAEVEACVGAWIGVGPAEIGVAEERHAPRTVLAPAAAVEVLGPRPGLARHQATWRDAAEALERHRERWGPEAVRALASGSGPGPLPVRRLVDHLGVLRRVEMARVHLGRSLSREAEAPTVGRER